MCFKCITSRRCCEHLWMRESAPGALMQYMKQTSRPVTRMRLMSRWPKPSVRDDTDSVLKDLYMKSVVLIKCLTHIRMLHKLIRLTVCDCFMCGFFLPPISCQDTDTQGMNSLWSQGGSCCYNHLQTEGHEIKKKCLAERCLIRFKCIDGSPEWWGIALYEASVYYWFSAGPAPVLYLLFDQAPMAHKGKKKGKEFYLIPNRLWLMLNST